MTVPSILVRDLPDDALLLDVREPDEWAAGRAVNAVHIPMGQVPLRLSDLPATDGPLPVICHVGGRSARVVSFLLAHGVDAVNVTGGTEAWAAAGKPMVADGGTPRVD